MYLFKTQNNYVSVTKGILEPNLCILLGFYNIYLQCGNLNVASCGVSISMSLIFLASYNFSSVIISVCGLYFCLAESLIFVLDFCILFSSLH